MEPATDQLPASPRAVADSLALRAGLATVGVILVAWLWSRPSWVPLAGAGADEAAGSPRAE